MVFSIVGVPKIANGIGAAQDALHQHVVIFTQLRVAGLQMRLFVFVKHNFNKEVKGAAVCAGDVAQNLFFRPFGIHIGPGLVTFTEDHRQFFHGRIGQKIVLLADGHRQRIRAHPEFNRCAPDGFTAGDFFVFDRAAGIGDIGFAHFTEALKTTARADAVNCDIASKAFVLKAFRHAFCQREHRGAACGHDISAEFQGIDLGEHCPGCRCFFLCFFRRIH